MAVMMIGICGSDDVLVLFMSKGILDNYRIGEMMWLGAVAFVAGSVGKG